MTALPADKPANRKLSVMATVRGALSVFHRHPWRFLRIAALPFTLILALELCAYIVFPLSFFAFSPVSRTLSLAGLCLLFLLPIATLNVALSRTILVTPEAPRYRIVGRRTMICFGYLASILVSACALALAAYAAFLTLAIDVTFAGQSNSVWGIRYVAGISILLVLTYVVARLTLVFPAVALGQKLGLHGSWRLSNGSGAKLCLAYLATFLIIGLLVLAGVYLLEAADAFTLWLYVNVIPVEYHYWPGRTVGRLPPFAIAAAISCIGAALLTGVSASAYAQLTGWGRPQPNVLERFD